MRLHADFQFSQASFQDYVDCPRRFQLRYVQQLAWPALEAEPALEHERHLQRGQAFHRLVHQSVVGVPPQVLAATAGDEVLRRWWQRYQDAPPDGLPAERYAEHALSAPLGEYVLVAKVDFLAIQPGERAVIADWKTSLRRPTRAWLAGRLQTRLYQYLLVRAGADLNGGNPWVPAQVEMVYWFAEFPASPERFAYDAARYAADEVYLAGLLEQIAAAGADDFLETHQEQRCQYCRYRSLCERGVRAGALAETDEAEPRAVAEAAVQLDFEQIAEIEY